MLPSSSHHTASDNDVNMFSVDLITVFTPFTCVSVWRYVKLGLTPLWYRHFALFFTSSNFVSLLSAWATLSSEISGLSMSLFQLKYSVCFIECLNCTLAFTYPLSIPTDVPPNTVPNNTSLIRTDNFSHCCLASSRFFIVCFLNPQLSFVYLHCDIVSTGSPSYPFPDDFPRDCARLW